jgi:hypothetical protein
LIWNACHAKEDYSDYRYKANRYRGTFFLRPSRVGT